MNLDVEHNNLEIHASNNNYLGERSIAIGINITLKLNPKLFVFWHLPILVSVYAVNLWSNIIAMHYPFPHIPCMDSPWQ